MTTTSATVTIKLGPFLLLILTALLSTTHLLWTLLEPHIPPKPTNQSTRPSHATRLDPLNNNNNNNNALNNNNKTQWRALNRFYPGEADYDTQKLTHVLMPFHVKQTSRAMETMQLWATYPPCVTKREHPSVKNNVRLRETYKMAKKHRMKLHGHAMLTFFIAGDPVNQNVDANLTSAFRSLPNEVQQCFSGVEFRYLHLVGKDDEYPRGCRLMFEHMLAGELKLQDPHYVYFMEPDCRPIRAGWLMVLDGMTRWPNPSFWAKGSLYRGSFKYVPKTKSFFYHVNGNALYNLRDPRFRWFYFDVVLPFIRDSGEENPYDIEIFRVLAHKDNWGLARTIYHKFQFTDVVQNMWHTEYSRGTILRGDDAVMVIHGGYPGY